MPAGRGSAATPLDHQTGRSLECRELRQREHFGRRVYEQWICLDRVAHRLRIGMRSEMQVHVTPELVVGIATLTDQSLFYPADILDRCAVVQGHAGTPGQRGLSVGNQHIEQALEQRQRAWVQPAPTIAGTRCRRAAV